MPADGRCGLAEPASRDALRGAALVQVRRQAAAEEGEAGAEDEAGVDLAGARDDAVVEEVAALVGERVENRARGSRRRCAGRRP